MPHRWLHGTWVRAAWLGVVLLSSAAPALLSAADLEDVGRLLQGGKYIECIDESAAAIAAGAYGESWHVLKAEAEMTVGRYADALETLTRALEKYSWSIKLRIRMRDALRFAGQGHKVDAIEGEVARLVEASPWRYTDAENLVLLGNLALALGADAKEVQDGFLTRARNNNPAHRLPRLALGQLALDKRDFALAADIFREGTNAWPGDPDLWFGLAMALDDSDDEAAAKAFAKVAELNPRYVPLLLRLIDRAVQGEKYDDAETQIRGVLEINPRQPSALAYWSVIAHLKNDADAERERREKALSTWDKNPEVDHIIGRELSQKYRFREGAEHQQQALAFDGQYLPAKKQLAEDLLRLGREEEGWKLVEETQLADSYDIGLYNLLTLRDEIATFATLERDGFVVRMGAEEAPVYGKQVLDLLVTAKKQLCEKYGVELTQPVVVEIFPNPHDFAVRTFGMPGVVGYLGVCFGNVITANSPASQESNPTNWESVLWHEFTHVVTLNRTHNKMPRWISEGISVYEERQRNPSWGERMTPAYREMILGTDLTPIGKLSSAFLEAKSPRHVAFAYFESSLVVEYILREFGLDALKDILADLGQGLYINDAIERRTLPLDQLDEGFRKYARLQATTFGLGVDWSEPKLDALPDRPPGERLALWVKSHPTNYSGLSLYADYLIEQEKWTEARPVLERMIALYPDDAEAGGPYFKLEELYERIGDREAQLRVLRRHVAIDDDAPSAYLKLLELESAAGNWDAVRENALRLRGVDPLVPHSHRYLADAAEQTGHADEALDALESWLALSPEDPATVHYRLARLKSDAGEGASAKRHVLMALEQAPRYRDAQKLLLKLAEDSPPGPGATPRGPSRINRLTPAPPPESKASAGPAPMEPPAP